MLRAALAIFLLGNAWRVVRILRLPAALRWELYPIPRGPRERQRYGGSYFEDSEWWTRPATRSLSSEIAYIAAEVLLLKGVWTHHRALWPWSWLLHWGLYALVSCAAGSLAFEERLGLLIDREMLYRDNRRLARLLQLAQLKHRNACVEDIDYRARRGLDSSQLASLAGCDWIRQAQNLLIHGATGAGKTWLACAFAQQACRQGLSALYLRAPRLFDELSVGHADGSFRKRLAVIAKVNLLVIDDFAIAPMGARERSDLLELLDDRVGVRATLLTSQLPIENWHDYIGDPTLADAILDRLVHSAHKIHLAGEESMRKNIARGGEKPTSTNKKID